MPQRLVYNPKAYVFTKDVNGTIYNLTNYCVGGEINRLINQVSNAKVTLRNPNKIFTNPVHHNVAFHPMDPITIYLERALGRPVQVFTGYLDTTPYYQMYPGTITLYASCTLKKLLYKFFDPALPYVTSFFEKYGWINTGKGSILSREAFNDEQEAQEHKVQLKPFEGPHHLNDGGMGKLLVALLEEVGEWKNEKIYIEELPPGVPELVATLMKDFEAGSKQVHEDYVAFTKAIIGVHAQGSGGMGGPVGGKTGEIKDVAKITETIARIANQKGLPPLFVMATAHSESGLDPNNVGGEGAKGYFQFTSAEPYPGIKVKFPQDAKDLGIATEAFCKAALAKGIKPESQWEQWATATQVSIGYPHWSESISICKKLLSQYAKGGGSGSSTEKSVAGETQRGATDKSGKGAVPGQTRIDAMIREASKITNQNYFYSWGGGHGSAGTPSLGTEHASGGAQHVGFDCSGSVAAVLFAGGLIPGGGVGDSGGFGSYQSKDTASGPAPSGSKPEVTVHYNGSHVWMTINGRYFSTGWNHHTNSHGGAGWGGTSSSEWPQESYQTYHFTAASLQEPHTAPPPPLTGGPGGGGEGGGATGEGGEDMLSTATAAAFTAEIAFPTLEDVVTSIALTGQKSLMNDQSLLPFIQQVAQASLRSFQSLPNGDFFGFYPDYFGEMGHRQPYWNIHDLETLSGGIDLSDDNLVTHAFCVGDNTWPVNNEFINKLFSAGTVNIFNAFESVGVLDKIKSTNIKNPTEGLTSVMNNKEAIDFLKRYGARPLVTDMPMVRTPTYEMLLAYQQFMLSWSRQFKTPFTFTFMPELYPGGKVGFPDHGLQMYIESVNHSWNLETGFTTTAQMIAPSLLAGHENIQLPENMVSALVEPVRGQTQKPAAKKAITSKKHTTPSKK